VRDQATQSFDRFEVFNNLDGAFSVTSGSLPVGTCTPTNIKVYNQIDGTELVAEQGFIVVN